MSSRMCRGNKISLTLFGASSPDYHPCFNAKLIYAFVFVDAKCWLSHDLAHF